MSLRARVSPRRRIHGEIGHHFGCTAPDDEPAEVSLSWMRSVAQPRSRAAASSASRAAGTPSWKSVRSGMPGPSRGSLPRIYAAIPREHGPPASTLTGPPAGAPDPPTGQRAARRPHRPGCRPGGPPAARPTRARSAREPRSNTRPGADQFRCSGNRTRANACAMSRRGQLIPDLREQPGESCHSWRLPAILIRRQRGTRRASPPGKLVLGQTSTGPGTLQQSARFHSSIREPPEADAERRRATRPDDSSS
jgi:hypothetical protein